MDRKMDFGGLYRSMGYRLFRMNRFEEYSLYAENKNFLVSDRVITFNDPSGRVMALKPDVTLSIAKSCPDGGETQKYYYEENVFRLDQSSGEYREIPQTGLECMGSLDRYSVCETVALAVRSLELISDECLLDLSDMGIAAAVFDQAGLEGKARETALSFLAAKNAHGLRSLFDVPEKADTLCELSRISGGFDEALPRLKAIIPPAAAVRLEELEAQYRLLCKMGVGGRLCVDFSVVNDMHYYNGLTFRGFVSGSPRAVLSGGRYDNLMKKLGKKAGAIGFAVYLDEALDRSGAPEWEIDRLVVYGDCTSEEAVIKAVNEAAASGKSVRTSREVPTGIRAKETVRLDKCEG